MSFRQFLLLLLFSHYIVSESLQPHGLQYTRLFCPPLSPRVCSNSCPLSRWCYLTNILCHLLLFLPSIFPSIRVFSNESALSIKWQKYWSFNFSSVLPMNIQDFLYWLDFFNWLDLLALQGTLKSLFQHHSSKASILQMTSNFPLFVLFFKIYI